MSQPVSGTGSVGLFTRGPSVIEESNVINCRYRVNVDLSFSSSDGGSRFRDKLSVGLYFVSVLRLESEGFLAVVPNVFGNIEDSIERCTSTLVGDVVVVLRVLYLVIWQPARSILGSGNGMGTRHIGQIDM